MYYILYYTIKLYITKQRCLLKHSMFCVHTVDERKVPLPSEKGSKIPTLKPKTVELPRYDSCAAWFLYTAPLLCSPRFAWKPFARFLGHHADFQLSVYKRIGQKAAKHRHSASSSFSFISTRFWCSCLSLWVTPLSARYCSQPSQYCACCLYSYI